jgi:hypothetical protein
MSFPIARKREQTPNCGASLLELLERTFILCITKDNLCSNFITNPAVGCEIYTQFFDKNGSLSFDFAFIFVEKSFI